MTGTIDKKIPQRILLGQIGAAHGIKGEVSIKTYTSDPAAIAAYGPLATKDGGRTFEINVVRVNDRGVVARITGINDRTAVEALRNIELYVERSKLPAPSEDEFYHADLIGLSVEDTSGHALGTVTAISNFGAGDLLEVEFTETKSRDFIPFTKAVVPKIDFTHGTITIDPAAYTPIGDPEPPSDADTEG
jgi:16S rRNA processing protein RimM